MRADPRLLAALILGSIVLVVVLLPLMLLTIPDPTPVRVTSLAGERSGAYFQEGQGLYKVFPCPIVLKRFPVTALATNCRPRVYVKYRLLDRLNAYGVFAYPSEKPVPVTRKLLSDHVLELRPARPLLPGQYYVSAAKGGMYGGRDHYYFIAVSEATNDLRLASTPDKWPPRDRSSRTRGIH